jgi:hypothetical protein
VNFFGDGSLGDPPQFTLGGDWGCAITFVGFITFLIIAAVVWQTFFN